MRTIMFTGTTYISTTTSRIAQFAIYALGGSAAIIKDYYKRDSEMQRPAFESPESITEENFIEHLGDENFYQGYVTFFTQQIAEKGVRNTLEVFIFSEKYNHQKGRDANAQPEMLARFFSNLVHALIHVGYGLEFGLKGMVVEGLALTAVHEVRAGRGTIPPSLFTPYSPGSGIEEDVASRISSLALDDTAAPANIPLVSKTGSVHAFDIVARILKDERFKSKTPTDFINQFIDIFDEFSPMVWEYAEKWTIGPGPAR
ncbi:hypothetical protein JVU11DRAFT_8695 [Chiua virens]|nr:hypothetical protein JVU11DRAFT_8695 [Chiua virens]